MQAFKQLGGGLLLGLISLIVVIGGISLALAEGYVPQPAPRLESPTSEFPTSEFVNGTLDFLLSPWPSETPFLPSTLALTNTPTLPPTPVSCPAPDGWMPIYVGPGETLEMIAARYQTTTSILIEGNCLPSTTILPGIPLYVPLPVGSTSTTCGHPSTWIQYTVQSGDTLYRISQLYRTTVTELQNANCLGGSTSIYAGQKLWVPNVATSTPLITATILTIEFNTATLAPTSTTEPPPTATTAPPPTATTAPPPTATTAPPPTATPSPTTSPQ